MPTDAEIQSFMSSLTAEQRKYVESLTSVIAAQAAAVEMLSRVASTSAAGRAAMGRALGGVVLASLGQKLGTPALVGPTTAEIQAAAQTMNTAIQSAQSAQDVFKTILQFGLKLAPLALV